MNADVMDLPPRTPSGTLATLYHATHTAVTRHPPAPATRCVPTWSRPAHSSHGTSHAGTGPYTADPVTPRTSKPSLLRCDHFRCANAWKWLSTTGTLSASALARANT